MRRLPGIGTLAPMLTRLLFAPLLPILTILGTCTAQRVVLPNATGGVTPATGWTVLREAELAVPERASDPAAQPARARLMAIVNELQTAQRTDKNVVFHQPGKNDGELRTVNAYSAEGSASSAELQGEEAVASMRDALEPVLGNGGAKVEWVGSKPCELFDVGGVQLTFVLTAADLKADHNMYVVPAGDRIQYFECVTDADDVDAVAACEQLISTFDGAKEAESRVRGLWIGGLAGALAGVLAALARRKRQARNIAGQGSATASGRDGAEG